MTTKSLFLIVQKFFLNNNTLSNNIHFVKEKNSLLLLLLTIIFFIIFGISIWFIKSPVIRFGIPYLLITVCFIFFLILRVVNQNFIINKGIFAIIGLVLIFNVSKNVKRIIDYEGQSYWPEILVFKYSHNSKYAYVYVRKSELNNLLPHLMFFQWHLFVGNIHKEMFPV